MTYLLDTDTLIFLVRGLKIRRPRTDHERKFSTRAAAIFSRCRDAAGEGSTLALSAITAAELEYGARKSQRYSEERPAVEKVLAPFQILPFDGAPCAKHYGEIREYLERKGNLIGAMDLLIAAHARAAEAVLVTNNREHFGRVPGLRVENWS